MTGPMRQRPAYASTSVDHALRLAQILQVEGSLTVTQAAERLQVARSTAHRLLSGLVYRDFALQDQERRYLPGPVLTLAGRTERDTARDVGALRSRALGPMSTLAGALNETVNLSVRAGRSVRIVASVECAQTVRIGSREGMIFPAHEVSGGVVMLAAMSDDELEGLYGRPMHDTVLDDDLDLSRLRREVQAVRRSGVAVNLERSERGVVAVGRAVRDETGDVVAALSVSMPTVRYSPSRVAPVVSALAVAVAIIGQHHDQPPAH